MNTRSGVTWLSGLPELLAFATAGVACALAQTSPPSAANEATSVVPRLVMFNGAAKDLGGQSITGIAGAVFSLYRNEEGGVPLWMETQNIRCDTDGHYVAQLGAKTPEGVPARLFTSGEARWLGVSINGAPEQPRVLLLSVPYALKAVDAQTLGGLPPSAFMLSPSAVDGTVGINGATVAGEPSLAGTGTKGYLPLWTDSAGDLGNSSVYQSGTGTTAKIGINTATPSAALDVKGAGVIRGPLTLPAIGSASAGGGTTSQPQRFTASAFNSSAGSAASQTFQWQAEPAGSGTSSPSGTLNLLFGSGSAAPSETGLQIASNGYITFPSGQSFPGTISGVTTSSGSGMMGGGAGGNVNLSLVNTCANGQVLQSNGGAWSCANVAGGTITGVTTGAGTGLTGGGTSGSVSLGLVNTCANGQVLQSTGGAWNCATISSGGTLTGVTAGTGLTGGGTSGNVTLNIDASKVPQLAAANTFTNTQNIVGNLGVSNPTAPSTFQLSGKDTGGTGIQNVTTNTSTSTNSFAIVSAASSSGVTAVMAADGLGTGPMGTSGAYFGTYTNQQVGFVTGNQQRAVLMPSGQLGVGVVPSDSLAMLTVLSGTTNQLGTVTIGAQITGGDGGSGAVLYGGNDTIYGGGGTGVVAEGGWSDLYPGYGGDGIDALAGHGWTSSGLAGSFSGDVSVIGNLSKSGGNFKIDHPLDPANKYLSHSFVESPDMMNIYNGNATLDGNGEATVELPVWFETLNRDFRYQLTAIGAPGPNLYIAAEVSNNSFRIGGGRPGMKVSWLVTGIRQDAWANAHRIPVEEDKPARERGFYLHPELFQAPEEKGIDWARHPELMPRIRARHSNKLPPAATER